MTLQGAVDRVLRATAGRLRGDDGARTDGRCRRPPEWLVLGINNACDLKCRMCDVGLGEHGTLFWQNLIGDHRQNMTVSLFADILRQASAFSPRPRIGLAFTEPLIHPQILDFCRMAVDAGLYCQVTTNGSMLPRLAARLVATGVDKVVVSVDGPPDVHDRIRGRAGAFERIAIGADRINEVKARTRRCGPGLGVSFTVTDANYDRVLDMVHAVEPFGASEIHISHLNFTTRRMADVHNRRYDGDLRVAPSSIGAIDPAAMPVDRLFEEIQRVKAFARARGSAFPTLHIAPDAERVETLRTFYQDELEFVGGRGCTDPWKMMMIRTDGSVIPAHGRCYSFPVGRVSDQPLDAIWNGPRFIEFRQTLVAAGGTLPACARCCGVVGKPVGAIRGG